MIQIEILFHVQFLRNIEISTEQQYENVALMKFHNTKHQLNFDICVAVLVFAPQMKYF